MKSRRAVSKTVTMVVLLVVGIAIGFAGGWMLQEQTIVSLTNARNSQAIYVDSANKEVDIQATANAYAFANGTMHGLNWQGGSLASEAAFITVVAPTELYNALMSLGATPSNNVLLTSAAGTLTSGTHITIYVTWTGAPKKYLLTDLLLGYNLTSGAGTFGFGGNLATNTKLATGCMACLYSCAVGIVSSNINGWQSPLMWKLNPALVQPGQNVTFVYQIAS
ncbi:MAG TPA: YdjY domain-containing protein [Conexivisphaerales archaeon]|nr:YdjY domain-containing protein [Conexivisphaerales archaeon]